MKLLTSVMVAGVLALGAGAAGADQKLAQKHACMSCHGVDKKIVGPSFKDVAKKYKGDAAAAGKLAEKVKKGGKGVWGEVPMPPNPQVPDADIQAIMKWVLSL
jgi:cytochrome c